MSLTREIISQERMRLRNLSSSYSYINQLQIVRFHSSISGINGKLQA